ncbi:MAG: HAD hydrolase-like protein [Candidatus Aenigmatarchaeota archaeon]
MPVKAILFDLDNTLIDFMAMKKAACNAAISAMIENGLKIKKDDGMKILFRLYSKKGLEYQKIFQLFLKEVNGKVDWKIMAPAIVAYKRVKEEYLYSYPRVLPTLRRLRKMGLKLAIVSDAPKVQVWTRLAAMGLHREWDIVLTRDDTKSYKMSKRPIMLALKRLCVKAEEAMMVGDSIRRDLRPAKQLGLWTVLARYGQIKKEKGKADFEIDRIDELIGLVKAL